MNVRRLFALVLVVAAAVLTSVAWFIAAEKRVADECTPPEPAVEDVRPSLADAGPGRTGPNDPSAARAPRGT